MYVSRFRTAVVVMILSAIIWIGSTAALFSSSLRILGSGLIGPIVPPDTRPSSAHSSEIRAVFIHSQSTINPNWNLIASTLKGYGFDTAILEIINGVLFARYPSAYIPHWADDTLGDALTAFHAQGMKLHISDGLLYGNLPGYEAMLADGSLSPIEVAPAKQLTRDTLLGMAEEIVTMYPDLDGFMFDYARYDRTDTSYDPEAKAAFETWLGETIPDNNWAPNIGGGGDFGPGGSRYMEFMEWRSQPINDLIRDMVNVMKSINPNIEISAAVWPMYPFPESRTYYLGQDFTFWIKEGYIDWVAPMIYDPNLDVIALCIQNTHEAATGGPEGKIPVVAFLANAFPAGSEPDPISFSAQIERARAEGADGFVMFRYGGPGDGEGGGAPDITPYLDALNLYPTFSVRDISASSAADTATITWTTDLPATSKVEYSTSPLFNASLEASTAIPGYHYWDVDHVPGTIEEDAAAVMSHSITLTGLSPGTRYYFRVQSQDTNAIATSKVYTFQL